MNPSAAVRALANDAAVTVTGRVADTRPFIQHASVVVAPLRVARGIQNKVLEAMAMAQSVVVTPSVASSLPVREGVEFEVGRDAKEFSEKIGALLDPQRASRMGAMARAHVEREYCWQASYALLDKLFLRGGAGPARAPNGMAEGPCALAAG
jgi:glycosyltransferase involved in cell wall biosynthesis